MIKIKKLIALLKDEIRQEKERRNGAHTPDFMTQSDGYLAGLEYAIILATKKI